MAAQKTQKIDVKTPAGEVEGSVELPAELFDVPANIALMHQVVTAQPAAARQGQWWWPQAVPAEGDWTRPAGLDAGPAVHRWRYRARSQAARLQPAHPQEDDRRCTARRTVRPGTQRPHPRGHRAGGGSDSFH